MSTDLVCRWEQSTPVAVLRLSGQLHVTSATAVLDALHEALAAQPAAIVVDLGQTTVLDDAALTMFAAFARTAAGWLACPLLVCAPTEPQRADLERLAVSRAVPVYPDRQTALLAAAALPAPRRKVHPLPALAVACRMARDLVDEACHAWQLSPEVRDDAAVVVTELVSNAVCHGGGDIQLQVAVGRHFLHLAVGDGSRNLPRFGYADSNNSGGRGLIVIDAVAAGWGTTPSGPGKTVWATVRISH